MKKFLLLTLFLFCVAHLSSAPANADPEVFEVKGKNIDYTGVYPAHIKTVAVITPASYPSPKSHNKGVELLRAAGLKVKVYPHASMVPENIKKQLLSIIHKQTSLEILSEQQISAILSIIKATTYLIKDLKQANNPKSLTLKKNIVQNIADIIDNLTIWIENGQKDAFHNHARFTLSEMTKKE